MLVCFSHCLLTDSLQLALIPEFAEQYVDYNGIKRKIQLVAALPEDERKKLLRRNSDGSWPKGSIDEMLENDLQKVVNLFNTRIVQLDNYVTRLSTEKSPNTEITQALSSSYEAEEKAKQLKELDFRLQQLSSFCEWNKLAFEKLAANMDKHLGTERLVTFYEQKVCKLDFANSSKIYESMIALKALNSSQNDSEVKDKLEKLSIHHPLKKDLLAFIQLDIAAEVVTACINAPDSVLVDILAASIIAGAKACMREVIGRIGLRSECLASALRRAINNLCGPDEGVLYFLEVLKQICSVVYVDSYHSNRLLSRILLVERNSKGQSVMHSVAKLGWAGLCSKFCEIVSSIPDSEPLNWMLPCWRDVMHDTPLTLAIKGNHVEALHALLSAQDKETTSTKPGPVPPLVLTCCVGDYDLIVEELILAGFNPNEVDASSNTALHTAVRYNRPECVKMLLKLGANPSARDFLNSWTPFMLASATGLSEIVSILVASGASVDEVDSSGWTAMEQAVVRGYLHLADKLRTQVALSDKPVNLHTLYIKASSSEMRSRKRAMDLQLSRSVVIIRISDLAGRIRVSLQGDDAVYVSGRSPSFAASRPSSVDFMSQSTDSLSKNDTTASNGSMTPSSSQNNSVIIDIPRSHFDNAGEVCLENLAEPDEIADDSIHLHYDAAQENSPQPVNGSSPPYELVFVTRNTEEATITIDLLANRSHKILGRTVCCLTSLVSDLGNHMQSLKPLAPLPLLSSKTLKPIAHVNADVLISKVTVDDRFSSNDGISTPALSLEAVSNVSRTALEDAERSLHKSATTTSESGKSNGVAVIGHRGLGKNQPDRLSLQLGENTLQSFIKAADLGASYVELDVQMTKDMVPVVYHDFIVNETGTDAQVHSLTLEQFLGASHSPSEEIKDDASDIQQKRRPRAYSSSFTPSGSQVNFGEFAEENARLKPKVYKGNALGHTICAPFTTLKDVLKEVPQSVGLNVEFKYPMLSEAEEEKLLPIAYDYNFYVDTILSIIKKYGGKRKYIFSSFNPDICILLSLKSTNPVLFLTEGGTAYRTDVRAASLRQALKFASQWSFLGIVSACEPLIMCPRLIKAVKQLGLSCYTYGVLNNDVDNVRRQVRFGVDAVIVDNVLAIRRALNQYDESLESD